MPHKSSVSETQGMQHTPPADTGCKLDTVLPEAGLPRMVFTPLSPTVGGMTSLLGAQESKSGCGHRPTWRTTPAHQMFRVTCGEVFVVGFCLKLIVDTLMRQLVTNCIIKMLKIAYLFPGKAEFPQFCELGKLLNFLDKK